MSFLHTDKPETVVLAVDGEGYREYRVNWIVAGEVGNGIFDIYNTPGLPQPGAAWTFDGLPDLWVWCRPNCTVSVRDGRGGETPKANQYVFYNVEQTFSNKPLDQKRCHEIQIEDPILEPPKISGSFVTFQEEATHDRFNRPIISSSWEQIRGPQVEFDRSRPTVEISMNVPIFSLPLVASMMDTVNDANLWGLLPRMIKLSRVSWSRLFYGLCYVYYNLNLGFDVNYDTFDRIIPDQGNKYLNGHWHPSQDAFVVDNIGGGVPDPFNPAHFIRAVGRDYNPISVVLDGRGLPAGTRIIGDDPDTNTGTGTTTYCSEIGNVMVQKYDEANFLLLGIPLVF